MLYELKTQIKLNFMQFDCIKLCVRCRGRCPWSLYLVENNFLGLLVLGDSAWGSLLQWSEVSLMFDHQICHPLPHHIGLSWGTEGEVASERGMEIAAGMLQKHRTWCLEQCFQHAQTGKCVLQPCKAAFTSFSPSYFSSRPYYCFLNPLPFIIYSEICPGL